MQKELEDMSVPMLSVDVCVLQVYETVDCKSVLHLLMPDVAHVWIGVTSIGDRLFVTGIGDGLFVTSIGATRLGWCCVFARI